MKKICVAIIIVLQISFLLVGCSSQTTATPVDAIISNDLSTINYNGQLYVLCSEWKNIPEDAERISSEIEDYTLLPLFEYSILYKSNTYPDYLWLHTSLNSDYKEFREADMGVFVLYKVQSQFVYDDSTATINFS